jgi:hypothetical protein
MAMPPAMGMGMGVVIGRQLASSANPVQES